MRIIRNNIIPIKGYVAMAIKPFIFLRKDVDLTSYELVIVMRHEKIHFAQQEELGLLRFLIMYLFYWVKYGYRRIPFEREAKFNEHNISYLQFRKPESYKRYIL